MDRAIIVGLCTNEYDEDDYSVEELKNLAGACDMEVIGVITQSLESPVAATYIGRGKAEEVAEMAENMQADYCIFEDTLSPAQLKNLQKIIKATIMDRTGLILEIFSKRARTREAKLQVETAKLQYMLPRLIGMWEAIGRQGGASGAKSNKGIGETQLELDRRWIQKRLTFLRRELETIEHDRAVQRTKREKSSLPLVALVGYTNAGKSTVMNRLLDIGTADEEKQVFEEDMLFATLDTSVRKITTGDKKDFLLSDTVGFVDKLPHSLVKAFRSTLDEIKYADLIVEIVDYSDKRYKKQMEITSSTLREIGVENIPIIHVFNKIDKCPEKSHENVVSEDRIFIAAAKRQGLSELVEIIKDKVYSGNLIREFLVPYSKGSFIDEINRNGTIIESEYRENGVYIKADVTKALYGRVKEFDLEYGSQNKEEEEEEN